MLLLLDHRYRTLVGDAKVALRGKGTKVLLMARLAETDDRRRRGRHSVRVRKNENVRLTGCVFALAELETDAAVAGVQQAGPAAASVFH